MNVDSFKSVYKVVKVSITSERKWYFAVKLAFTLVLEFFFLICGDLGGLKLRISQICKFPK